MPRTFELDPLATGDRADRQLAQERTRVLTAQGYSAREIGARVGRTPRTITRWRSAYGWISPLQPPRNQGDRNV